MKTSWFAKGRTLGAFAAVLFATVLAQAAPSLSISPSRTSGVAPLYVFFDATGTTNLGSSPIALPEADFSWDFDTTNVDPTGKWEQTKGFVAGHVFEAPGTYTVSCTVTGADGTTDTDTVTITVSAFSGTTYYVAANGSNSNPGTQAQPWLTSTHAFSQLSGNEQILFRRGDTFPGSAGTLSNRSGGPMIIGAYGTGAAPVLNTRILPRNSHDIRFMDLHLVLPGQDTAVRPDDGSSHILALRLEVEGTEMVAFSGDESDTVGVFDCHLHDIFRLGAWESDCSRFSWVGNTMENLARNALGNIEHGMRLQRGEKHFVAHNVFSKIIDADTGITIRGNHPYVVIYANVLDRIIAINPQQNAYIEFVSDVLVEGNYVGLDSDYAAPTIRGINLQAQRVVVRNNVIDGYQRAIELSRANATVPTEDIAVYHNTINWRPVSSGSGSGGTLIRVRDSSNVTVRNNMISAPTLAQAIISDVGSSTNVTVSDNLQTVTPGYVTNPLPDSGADINSPLNYALLSTSPARNAGANAVPVFHDLEGFPRPSGSNKDVGAFEFDEGDSAPMITTTLLPDAVQGSAYSQALVASGGDAPLGWSVASGSLPAGLSLSSGGVLSGTPTGAGTSNFTVQVVDVDSDTDTQALSIFVDSIPNITTTTLPGGTQGSAYSQTLAVTGGNPPLTWSLASGTLPTGLSLNSGGVISGTPTGSGTSNFTVQVSDNDNDIDTQVLSLTVSASATQYTYLRFEMTGTTNATEGRILELDWRVGSTEYPNPHYTTASADITGTGGSTWQAYDGLTVTGSFWNAQATTGTITLYLSTAIAPTSIRIRPVNENRAPSGFVVRGSNNGTTWTTLRTVTGLTTATWSSAGNDVIFSIP
jgi:hypothetical protein